MAGVCVEHPAGVCVCVYVEHLTGVCVCICVCAPSTRLVYVCVCAEHPAGVCVCVLSTRPSPVHSWSQLSTAQGTEKGKLPPYCASELMGSQLHPVLLGSPKKPRTLYHTAGLMLAFAAPEGSPRYSLR